MQFSNYVTSLLIPISNSQLLLPSIAVAEILHDLPLETSLGNPDWLTGLYTWRNQQIPLISLEEMTGLPFAEEPESEPRVVVIYGSPQRLPYYAFRTQGMPHSLQVVKDLLLAPTELTDNPGLLASVEIETRLTWLPDLDYVEQSIAEMI